MKKLLLIILTCFIINVNADVKTYERTEEDLRIRDSIIVNSYNKDNIMNIPSIDETLKVYDFADILTSDEENNLYYEATKFISEYNMDLALVTIDDNFETAMEYANDFYDYNYFGLGDTYDGLLILIDMDNREFYISTTGEAILMYNDYRIDGILDNMTPYMKSGSYYQAFSAGITTLSDYAKNGIPEGNKSSYIDSDGNYIYVEQKSFPLSVFLIISFIVSTIVLIIFINKNKLVKKAYQASSYMNDNKKVIKNISDTFLTTHTSRVRINTDSGGSSSSSHSGGSSTHHSSSGSSHGGGGRSF